MENNFKWQLLIIGIVVVIAGLMLVVVFKHDTTKNSVPTDTVSLPTPTIIPQRTVTAQPFPHSGPLGASFSHHPKSQ